MSPQQNPVGCYRRSLELREQWLHRKVHLVFEGVDSAFHVWVNGHFVGYSQGSHLHAEFNVSPYLQAGKNGIAVQVYQWSDGSYLESQDKWRMSGIFRDVYLLSFPQVSIRDASVRTRFMKDYSEATLEVQVDFDSDRDGPLKVEGELRMTLIDEEGRIVCDRFHPLQWDLPAVDLTEKVLLPNLWTAETPHLYSLLLTTSSILCGAM